MILIEAVSLLFLQSRSKKLQARLGIVPSTQDLHSLSGVFEDSATEAPNWNRM